MHNQDADLASNPVKKNEGRDTGAHATSQTICTYMQHVTVVGNKEGFLSRVRHNCCCSSSAMVYRHASVSRVSILSGCRVILPTTCSVQRGPARCNLFEISKQAPALLRSARTTRIPSSVMSHHSDTYTLISNESLVMMSYQGAAWSRN